MVFLIGLLVLLVLFLRISVGAVCFVAAAGVLIFGFRQILGSGGSKTASRKTLLRTVILTGVLIGLGVFLHDLNVAMLLFS